MLDDSSSAGRYDVSEELGRGSMGIVCLAHDPVMGRDLALKTILLPHGLPEEEKYEFRERFRREAQAAGRLSHPGIVTVYDYSESEDDLPYIAMEYIQGFTLHELIAKEGALSPDWALDMVEMLADALDAAHAAGVIHRDLKPANILVRESDGTAKITDFGIARINSNDKTQAGTTYGSPAYMAPERIQGQSADARSDFFSLAVILYEALSGARPFNGDDFASICYAIVNEPPIPIRTQQPALSLAFDAFFRRALAKDPTERFQNGVSFRQGLESVRHQQRIFETGSETMKMLMPIPTAEVAAIREPGEMLATPVPAPSANPLGVPWRWVAVGALAMLLLLSSFIMGWVLSGDAKDGQVGVPLNVGTRPAAVERVEAVEGTSRSTPAEAQPPVRAEQPIEDPAPVEVIAPPTQPVAEPVAAVTPEPTPVKPSVTPELEAPVESAEAVTAPETAAAPIDEALTEELPPAEALAEETSVPEMLAVLPGAIPVNVRIKNGIKEGKLTLLVDGEEIETIPLGTGSESAGKSLKKVLGKGLQELETQITILPGQHTVTAVAYSSAKDREYEASVDFDLEPGDMRTLRIVAGKSLGKRLTMKLD